MFKKTLILLAALCLLISLIPVTALAELDLVTVSGNCVGLPDDYDPRLNLHVTVEPVSPSDEGDDHPAQFTFTGGMSYTLEIERNRGYRLSISSAEYSYTGQPVIVASSDGMYDLEFSPKPMLTGITAPLPVTLREVYTSADAVIHGSELPSTVSAQVGADPVSLPCEWSFTGTYDTAGDAENVFHWSADASAYNYTGHTTSGTAIITNKTATISVATPTISLAAGTYTGTQSVTLSCETPGATIRYTLDGSVPSDSSTLYNADAAISVSSSCTLKAKAFKAHLSDSNTASATYTITDRATSVWIAGQELTSENPYYHNGTDGTPGTADNLEANSNACFDASAGTLTLRALNVRDCTAEQTMAGDISYRFTYAIFATGDLTICVDGNNSVSVARTVKTDDWAFSAALAVAGDLTVQPVNAVGGTLLAEAKGAESSIGIRQNFLDQATCVGINAELLSVKSGVTLVGLVSGTTVASGATSAGVNASNIAVTGGTLYATAGEAVGGSAENSYTTSSGIYLFGDTPNMLEITGGCVRAVGGNATGVECRSFGVEMMNGRAEVSGGSFTAKSGTAETAHALSHQLSLGSGLTAQASTFGDGSSPVVYDVSQHSTYKWVSVSPSLTVMASPSGSVAQNAAVTLTAVPENIPNATYQWYSNNENLTEGASFITGATSATYAPPTGTLGTVYYFCVANDVTSNVVGVTVATPTVTNVVVNPISVSVQKGGHQTFNATVIGERSPAQTVTWSVLGNLSSSTVISTNGILTVGSDETASTLTVTATSTADPSFHGLSAVTVTTPDPIEYEIIQGQDGVYVKGGAAGLGFTADADYSAFTGVSMDGTDISSDQYTSASGSTIVTLKASYLSTLSVGQHTLRMNFTNGYAETHFTIRAAADPTNPATGDNSRPWLWMGIALLAGTGVAASLILSRRKRQ